MSSRYNQRPVVASGSTRFELAPEAIPERSRMREVFHTVTAFNAGDIVPIRCIEVLPSQSIRMDISEVVRQSTLKFPTMGEMLLDVYAFFVPNRVVNESWKEVQGENSAGTWTAPDIQLAPLVDPDQASTLTLNGHVDIPVGSVADYYGLPSQSPIPVSNLALMHDLKFRGYLEIYNQYFRDQNWQAPIPYSKLNIYNAFLVAVGAGAGTSHFSVDQVRATKDNAPDGSYPNGAAMKAVFDGPFIKDGRFAGGSDVIISKWANAWSALDKPLKANKLHDAFTSVLPSPQKGPSVEFELATPDISIDSSFTTLSPTSGNGTLTFGRTTDRDPTQVQVPLVFDAATTSTPNGSLLLSGSEGSGQGIKNIYANISGITATASGKGSAISVEDLRYGIALQQLYELYGRSGTRYREIVGALFGIEADDPFLDIPKLLGHHRVSLELYQTAQTSATTSISPQGTLAGYGYTSKGGSLFHETFLEHGYVHILAVVRQRNLYPAYLAPDWFRTKKLDFYNPVFANISEQPILSLTLNPTASSDEVLGYQEAWYDYRQHVNEVSGIMREGVNQSLAAWTYQDDYDSDLASVDADWLKSNAQEVLDPTLAITSSSAPQFIADFAFTIENDFPGPVYSVPGLDQI